mmetsp:Transcript_20908/g.60892  ORF Transcript_20908/g.60892 Transcript_20908/m.60892 type:complete len:266 (-) Transcript_20908:85-882(-)
MRLLRRRFEMTFMAWTDPVVRLRTWRTFPKAPMPMTLSSSKSLGVMYRFFSSPSPSPSPSPFPSWASAGGAFGSLDDDRPSASSAPSDAFRAVRKLSSFSSPPIGPSSSLDGSSRAASAPDASVVVVVPPPPPPPHALSSLASPAKLRADDEKASKSASNNRADDDDPEPPRFRSTDDGPCPVTSADPKDFSFRARDDGGRPAEETSSSQDVIRVFFSIDRSIDGVVVLAIGYVYSIDKGADYCVLGRVDRRRMRLPDAARRATY